jgi:hypothetical protein
MTDKATCELCGEPMPEGETMFKYHGYSGPCPKPPLPLAKPRVMFPTMLRKMWSGEEVQAWLDEHVNKTDPA